MAFGRNALAVAIAGVALLATASFREARAEWAALSWDACGAEVLAKQFACDTNVGSARMVVSAFRDSVGARTLGFEVSLEIVVAQGQPLSWWQTAASQCRDGAMSISAVSQPEDAACSDVWFSMLSTGGSVESEPGVPRIKLRLVGADNTASIIMQPFIETFVATLNVSYEKSVGPEACEGCASSACVLLRQVDFAEIEGYAVTMPVLAGHGLIAWQTTPIDCATTPVRNRTWGAIKALYR